MSPSKEFPSSGAPPPNIAIKGFSLAPKAPPTTKPKSSAKPPSSSLGKRPRTHFGHDDSDSEDDHHKSHGKHVVVTGFENGKVLRKEEKPVAAPMVIPKLGNTRDFRAEARAQYEAKAGRKNLLPPEVQAEMAAKEKAARGEAKKEGTDVLNSKDGEIVWGLSVRKREKASGDTGIGEQGNPGDDTHTRGRAPDAQTEPVQERTVDEEALSALLGEDLRRKGPDLIIPTVSAKQSEESAYRAAVAAAPDASTLEDYERVPVEEFGAALLRGMGWDGKEKGKPGGKEVKRRQNLLGLGAKELKDAEELGAWVQKSDVKRLKPAGSGGSRPERKPKPEEYKRERDEKKYKEGGYREERERERNGGRRDGGRNGYRERERHGDRDRDRERERDHRDRRDRR